MTEPVQITPEHLRSRAQWIMDHGAPQAEGANKTGILHVCARVFTTLAEQWETGQITQETVTNELAFFANRMSRYMTAKCTEQRTSAVMGVIAMAGRLNINHVWLLTGHSPNESEQ